ncbi:MAG: hypothetical protein IBJ11_05225, partial [Phycisphaerales bacterium]|nr:hypothetical protein [Phycisphaerales bacterium]
MDAAGRQAEAVGSGGSWREQRGGGLGRGDRLALAVFAVLGLAMVIAMPEPQSASARERGAVVGRASPRAAAVQPGGEPGGAPATSRSAARSASSGSR